MNTVESPAKRSFFNYLMTSLEPPADASRKEMRIAGAVLCAVVIPLMMVSYAATMFLMLRREPGTQSLSMLVLSMVNLIMFVALGTGFYRILWPTPSSILTRIPKALVAAAVSFVAMCFLVVPVMVLTTVIGRAAEPQTKLYSGQGDATKDVEQALAKAGAEHKRVLVDFGADWCPDCVVLARLLDGAAVKPFVESHFVMVRVNVGKWDLNLDLSKKYGDPIKKGIPAVVVLNPDGKVVATTANGALSDARHSTAEEVLALLKGWAEHP